MPLLLPDNNGQVCKEGMNAGRRMLVHFIHMNHLTIMPAPLKKYTRIIVHNVYAVNRLYDFYMPHLAAVRFG